MTTRRLQALIGHRQVGTLSEENGLWRFDYAPGWQAAADAFDLSPALPREQAQHVDGASQRPVQWYFDNLLPEEALRLTFAKEADISAEDAFGLLAHFAAESAGSLVLQDPDAPSPVEHGLKPLPYAELMRRIGNLPKTPLTHDAPKRMSLAGAQHKLTVVLHGDGALFEPQPGTASTHILKPSHPDGDYPASVINEFFAMRLAQAVGVRTPRVQCLRVPAPVYVVERFDRVIPPAGAAEQPAAVQRLHVIDTCQLLNKPRLFKYQGANLATLAAAVRHCRFLAAARLQLFRWIVFNVLVGNGDNHLKNISFLIGHHGIEIAPAYDLLSTAVYETRAIAAERASWPSVALALTLDDASTFDQIRRSHLIAAAAALGLAAQTAQRELERMAEALPRQADRLIDAIQSDTQRAIEGSPDPAAARAPVEGEMRLLRTVRHLILKDMLDRIA